jgi:hypothetical protein
VAKLVFDSNLAGVPRPVDLEAFIRGFVDQLAYPPLA